MKKLLILIVVSLAISTAIFFINSTVIKSTWSDILIEILVMAIPVFIVVALLFYANRAIIRRINSMRK